MNLPIENQQTPGPGDDRLVDRLVDGELPDVERRELLLRFENEPDGWRRCALAFLEAQNWRQAFASVAATAAATARPVLPDSQDRKRSFWRPVARLTAIAAGLVAAFVLGRSYYGGPEEPAASDPVAQQTASSESQQPAPVKLPAPEAKPSRPAELALLDPILKGWEQRGYSVETERRLVSMKSKDGRKLDVPVQEIRLRYIGNHTY
jgi:negative regulator of sigma E activity